MSTAGPAGMDGARVSDWIGGLGLGARAPLTFARVGNGRSNLTYLVTDEAGQQWVLRRPPVGPALPSAHDVAREHRVLSALEGTGVPAPRTCGFTDDPAVADAPLFLMSYVDGLVVDDVALAERLSPASAPSSAARWPARSPPFMPSTSRPRGSARWPPTSRTPHGRSSAGGGSGMRRGRATCPSSTRSPTALRRRSPNSASLPLSTATTTCST